MRCNICYNDIFFDQKGIKCPRCLNDYHHDHLAAWLLTESNCPTCREILSTSFRDSLKPKSDRDRIRLQEISNSLNSIGRELDRWERRNKTKLRRIREKRAGVKREPIPWAKLIIPPILFIIWVAVLIGLFLN